MGLNDRFRQKNGRSGEAWFTDFWPSRGLNWIESPLTLALNGEEGVASVWGELKRRNVVKVAVAYGAERGLESIHAVR